MPRTSACPGQQVLGQFLLGKLSDAASAEVEAHLDHCEACAEALHSLQARDTVVDAVRKQPTVEGADDPAVRDLVGRLNSIPAPVGGSAETPTLPPSAAGEIPAAAEPPDVAAILAPA